MSDIKPPKPMTVEVLRDHLTMLIEEYGVGNLPIMLIDSGEFLVNASIDHRMVPYVETWEHMKKFM